MVSCRARHRSRTARWPRSAAPGAAPLSAQARARHVTPGAGLVRCSTTSVAIPQRPHGRQHPRPGPRPVYDRYMKSPSEVGGTPIRRSPRCPAEARHPRQPRRASPGLQSRKTGGPAVGSVCHAHAGSGQHASSGRCRRRSHQYRLRMPSVFHVTRPIVDATLTVRGSAQTQHAIGN